MRNENKELIDAFSFYNEDNNKEQKQEGSKELINAFSFYDDKEKEEAKKNLVQGMSFEERTKNFEEKTYIILYVIQEHEDNAYNKIYSICLGRTETYNDIKEKLISGINMDIHKSKIITETKQTETETGNKKYYLIPIADCISVYTFCKSVEGYYNDESFDIERYNEGLHEDNSVFSEGYRLTREQIEYRNLMEESEKRKDIIRDIRDMINNGSGVDFHNI